jgi:hypothetical protein
LRAPVHLVGQTFLQLKNPLHTQKVDPTALAVYNTPVGPCFLLVQALPLFFFLRPPPSFERAHSAFRRSRKRNGPHTEYARSEVCAHACQCAVAACWQRFACDSQPHSVSRHARGMPLPASLSRSWRSGPLPSRRRRRPTALPSKWLWTPSACAELPAEPEGLCWQLSSRPTRAREEAWRLRAKRTPRGGSGVRVP